MILGLCKNNAHRLKPGTVPSIYMNAPVSERKNRAEHREITKTINQLITDSTDITTCLVQTPSLSETDENLEVDLEINALKLKITSLENKV